MFHFQNTPDPSEYGGATQTFSLQAPCLTHNGQNVTNFCKVQGCLMPLCPKCIPQHIDKHRQLGEFAELCTVDEMHEETLQLIKQQLTNLNQALQLLNKFKEQKSDSHGQLHETLNSAKQRILRLVDAFFDDLIHELEQVTKADRSSLDIEIQQMERSLNQQIQEYQLIDQKLRTPKYLKQIVQLQTGNFIKQTQQQRIECEAFIEEVSKHTLDIQLDEQQLYFINMQLAKYSSIKNAEYYKQQGLQPLKPTTYNHPYLVSEINQKQDSRIIEQSPYKKLEQQFQQINNSFQINLPDFYDSLSTTKYLHYFTDKSVYILNLDQLQNYQQPKWYEIKLNCQIPLRSSSVRSQQGDIYVVGGFIGNQLSAQIFRLDLKQQTLLTTDALQQNRHSASSIIIQNKLYVIGGQNLAEDLNTMEVIDLSLQKSKTYVDSRNTQLPKMQIGGPNLSICSFRQFILKATPLEIFDIRQQKWTQLNIPINRGVGLIAINNSNVLIFGNGQYSQIRMIDQNTSSFQIENLQNSPQITNVHPGSLIYQGKIFAIGNNNRLIIGSSDGWII